MAHDGLHRYHIGRRALACARFFGPWLRSAVAVAVMVLSTWSISAQRQESLVDLVNPLVGTLSSFEVSTGNTYPVISRPWGMNSWTPQTGKMGDGWQYTYTSGRIRGIKQTHQPSPWINDYGQFAIMPVIGRTPIFDEEARASWFSHKSEVAKPYYYSVYLADYDTNVELAPSERAARMRIHYSRASLPSERWIILDAFDQGSEVHQQGNTTLVGYSRRNSGGVPDGFRCYFVLDFGRPIKQIIRSDSTSTKGGDHARVAVLLEGADRSVDIAIASSFVSPEQAQINLWEVLGKSLDMVKHEGRNEWNSKLERLYVQDQNHPDRATFYSNLYRSLLFPRRFYEINGKGDTIHYSPYNGHIEQGVLYTDTGLWDTFRALFPLINLVYPEEGAKMQEGMLAAYRESGFFPEWASPGHRDCMVGNNSASVVADAFIKGLGRIDTTTLIAGLLNGADNRHPIVKSTGRYGHEYYNRLGYIPYNVGINENAARTLEYAYNDWCIWQALRHAGASPSLQKVFADRAKNYRHLYDPSTGWMRGRNLDGSFQSPFSPYKWGDAFTEGNAIHYTWSVFHDVQGLIDLMGGDEAFIKKLDTVFTMPPHFDNSYYGFTIHEIREMQIMDMGNYAHGNQPIQHMLYLYPYAGMAHKAQQRIREVMKKLYSNAPDGYCGDEDNGQTSAWYVFSALGFYPVTPASSQYVIGIPLFGEVELRLPSGTTIIRAENAHHTYIQSVVRDGKSYDRPYITYGDLLRGGTFTFRLGATPSAWGSSPKLRPYSMTPRK